MLRTLISHSSPAASTQPALRNLRIRCGKCLIGSKIESTGGLRLPRYRGLYGCGSKCAVRDPPDACACYHPPSKLVPGASQRRVCGHRLRHQEQGARASAADCRTLRSATPQTGSELGLCGVESAKHVCKRGIPTNLTITPNSTLRLER